MSKKLSKREVSYRDSMSMKHCGNCDMYRPIQGTEGECTLVEGQIHKWDVCDRWEHKE